VIPFTNLGDSSRKGPGIEIPWVGPLSISIQVTCFSTPEWWALKAVEQSKISLISAARWTNNLTWFLIAFQDFVDRDLPPFSTDDLMDGP